MGFDKNILIERMEEIRKENNWSQKELGDVMGCGQSAVSGYLNLKAQALPTIDCLFNLCHQTGISADWFLGIEKNKTVREQRPTAADVIEKLLWIEEQTDVTLYSQEDEYFRANIGCCNEIVYSLGFRYDRDRGLYDYLADFMKEWHDVRKLCFNGGDIGKKLYMTWKEEKVKEASGYFLDELPFELAGDSEPEAE